MHCIKQKIILAMAILGCSTAALAALYEDGPYIEGNIGALHDHVDFMGFRQDGFESAILNFTAGYQWNRYFSTEAGVTRYQRLTGGSLNAATASAKASYPLSIEGFDFTVFGKAGPGYYFNADGNSSVRPQTAFGATTSRTEKTDYIFQLTSEPGEPFNYNGLLVGMIYHFD